MTVPVSFVICGPVSIKRLSDWLARQKLDVPLEVRVSRREPMNSYHDKKRLRALEAEIARFIGTDPRSLHEDLLRHHFGFENREVRTGFVIRQPNKRTSDLTVAEMHAYTMWVQAFAATEFGMEFAA